MERRYLETDPLTGAVEEFEWDEDTDQVYIHRTVNTDEAIDHNKAVASEWDGWNDDKSRRLAAHIPMDVAYLWVTKYGVEAWNDDHAPAVKRLLNSNEWRYLRIGHFII